MEASDPGSGARGVAGVLRCSTVKAHGSCVATATRCRMDPSRERPRIATTERSQDPGPLRRQPQPHGVHLAMEQAQGDALAHVGAIAAAGRAGPSVGAGGSGESLRAAATGLKTQ